MQRAILAVATILFLAASHQADVLSSGDWSTSISSDKLIAGAGTPLPQTFQSMSGATTLTITNEPGPWRLVARRSDTKWASSVTLTMKRTSDGSGSGAISCGSTYVEITSIDTEICSGAGDRNNVTMQYRLDGISLATAPDDYSTSIIFTIVH